MKHRKCVNVQSAKGAKKTPASSKIGVNSTYVLRVVHVRIYRGVNKGLYVLLSRTQAGPGRTVKQEQEEISRNHVQTFIYLSVFLKD